jgi:hypothetical protein
MSEIITQACLFAVCTVRLIAKVWVPASRELDAPRYENDRARRCWVFDAGCGVAAAFAAAHGPLPEVRTSTF